MKGGKKDIKKIEVMKMKKDMRKVDMELFIKRDREVKDVEIDDGKRIKEIMRVERIGILNWLRERLKIGRERGGMIIRIIVEKGIVLGIEFGRIEEKEVFKVGDGKKGGNEEGIVWIIEERIEEILGWKK